MYYLIYTSHASKPYNQDELQELLIECRINNKPKKVTGMLVYLQGKFIQVLEGEQQQVTEIYESIILDPRHKKVTKVMEGVSQERIFKDWSMGFKKLSDSEFEELSGYKDPEEFLQGTQVNDDSPTALIFLSLFFKKNYVDFPEMQSY